MGREIQAVVALAALGPLYGQPPAAPRFEVASVKRGGEVFSTRPILSPGRFRWTTQLCYLIGYAFGLDFSRVAGPRVGSIYSIEAIGDPAATDSQTRLMLQALLLDRFKLRAHRVTTESDGYALVVGKRGLKVRASAHSSADKSSGFVAAVLPGDTVIAITGRGATMSQLAQALERSTQMPVWDRTGLEQRYDFDFRFARELTAGSQPDAPPLPAALEEDLGLRLEKRKGPVETLVIDHVEEPSPN